MALARVLIAAAWADGAVSNEEVNCLKDLLFRMPGMTANDWAKLEIYLDAPVGEDEFARLVADLQDALAGPRDRELALAALEDLIQADAKITDDERAAVDEIRTALDDVNLSIFGQLGRLVRGPVQRRSEALSTAPNRERNLRDFIRNRVFYKLNQRSDVQIDLPEPEIRKLSLAGGLMARVAYVDREITEGELESMVTALMNHWKISRESAQLVAEIASSEIGKDMDYYRLSREFFESTSEPEREEFLRAMFAVAAADGKVSHEEMEEIRTIALVLKLDHKQFIDAKLTIPREQRAY